MAKLTRKTNAIGRLSGFIELAIQAESGGIRAICPFIGWELRQPAISRERKASLCTMHFNLRALYQSTLEELRGNRPEGASPEIIDFSKLWCGEMSEVSKLLNACQTEGFFYLNIETARRNL